MKKELGHRAISSMAVLCLVANLATMALMLRRQEAVAPARRVRTQPVVTATYEPRGRLVALAAREEVFEEAQEQHTPLRVLPLVAQGITKAGEFAGDMVHALASLPAEWADITHYSPEEAICLAGYQIRYHLGDSPVLDYRAGTVTGPSGNETYYNLDMSWVVWRLEYEGYEGEYYIREDGVKMYGDYIMCAGDFSVHPFGSIVQTSLGEAIVCDTGMFIYFDPYHIDIAAAW